MAPVESMTFPIRDTLSRKSSVRPKRNVSARKRRTSRSMSVKFTGSLIFAILRHREASSSCHHQRETRTRRHHLRACFVARDSTPCSKRGTLDNFFGKDASQNMLVERCEGSRGSQRHGFPHVSRGRTPQSTKFSQFRGRLP